MQIRLDCFSSSFLIFLTPFSGRSNFEFPLRKILRIFSYFRRQIVRLVVALNWDVSLCHDIAQLLRYQLQL